MCKFNILTSCITLAASAWGFSHGYCEGVDHPESFGRADVEAHWLRVPQSKFADILDDKHAAAARAGTIVSREASAELIKAAREDASGKCFRLRNVKLGVGERVTFDPYHVPEDPRHRWSGFTTDDTYLVVERMPDEEGNIALRAKIGLMNRPKKIIAADNFALPRDATLVLRGFDATGDEGKLMDVLLVHAVRPRTPPAERKRARDFPYSITHRDGTHVRGSCGSLTEVFDICGETPETVIAAGQRRPPRISLDTPSWEMEATKKCDDGDLKQIARACKLRILRVAGCHITDAGLAALSGQQKLADLQIVTIGRLTDESVSLLTELPSLYYLKLQHAELHGETLRKIAVMPALRFLHLTSCKFHGDALGELQGSETLQKLDLNGSTSGDAGIRGLGKLKKLASLDLSGVRIRSMPEPRPLRDADLRALGELRSLTSLRIQTTDVSMNGLTQLAEIPKLWIDHHHSRVSDIDAKILANRFGWTFQGDCSCGCLDIQPRR